MLPKECDLQQSGLDKSVLATYPSVSRISRTVCSTSEQGCRQSRVVANESSFY